MASISATGTAGAALTAILATWMLCAPAAEARTGGGTDLTLTFENARNTRGLIRICLTSSARHFPDCRGDAAARSLSIPASSRTARIEGLAPGTYGVSVLHDENGNGRMDMAIMIPREGFGFSRNPRIGMGAPRFDAVSFTIGSAPAAQTIRLRYML